MLKRWNKFTLISLCVVSLIAMWETQARAQIITGGGTQTCLCYDAGVKCRTKDADHQWCHRSWGGTCSNKIWPAGTAKAGQLYCFASLEEQDIFADASDASETELVEASSSQDLMVTSAVPMQEQIATFAASPSPTQMPTFVSMNSSEPILLAAKVTIEPAPEGYNCHAFGTGAGNPTQNPAVTICSFRPDTVAVHCMTNGGGDGGLGSPFHPDVSLTGDDIFDDTNLDPAQRGRWFTDSDFTQAKLNEEIIPPAGVCKQNWQLIPNSLTILAVTVDIKTHDCSEPLCANPIQPPVDRWIGSCTATNDQNNLDGFKCVEVIHCKDLDQPERDQCLTQIL